MIPDILIAFVVLFLVASACAEVLTMVMDWLDK